MLRRCKQRVHGFLQRGVFRKRAELAHHRAGNRKAARHVFHLREGCFLRRTDIDEKRNENQERIKKQPDKTEHERKTLPDSRGHLRRARIAHPRGQQRAQHPAAIHRKCGQQIEKKQNEIHRE